MYSERKVLSVDGKYYVDIYVQNESPEIALSHLRPMVVVLPGGGYMFTSDREAEPVALAYVAAGFNAAVVRYSVGQDAVWPNPQVDVSAALKYIRDNAKRFLTDPHKIALCGFSAGGHLAASLGVHWDNADIRRLSGISGEDNRPDALVLCYPVITTGEYAHEESAVNVSGGDPELREFLSLEKRVSANMPPTFLWHCIGDESVPVENSLLLANAMQRAGVDYECHLFAGGAHGISMCNQEVETPNHEAAAWTELCKTWLNKQFHYIP